MNKCSRVVFSSNILDYIPIASTVKSLHDLFYKTVVLSRMSESQIGNDYHYVDLKEKHPVRCFILLVPVLGNIVIRIYDFFDVKKWSDEKFVLAQVTRDGNRLRKASQELRNNQEIVKAAATRDVESLQFASENLKQDKTFMHERIEENSCAFEYLDQSLQNDQDIVGFAFDVALKAGLFTWSPKGGLLSKKVNEFFSCLKNDYGFMKNLTERNWQEVEYASQDLRNDSSFMLPIVKAHSDAYQFVGDQLKQDENFIVELCKSGLFEFDQLPSNFQDRLDCIQFFIEKAIGNDRVELVQDESTALGKAFKEKISNVADLMFYLITEVNISWLPYADLTLRTDLHFMVRLLKSEKLNGKYLEIFDALEKALKEDQLSEEEIVQIRGSFVEEVFKLNHPTYSLFEKLSSDLRENKKVLEAVRNNLMRSGSFASDCLEHGHSLQVLRSIQQNEDSLTNPLLVASLKNMKNENPDAWNLQREIHGVQYLIPAQ